MTILTTIQRYRDQLDALLTGQPERTDLPRPLAERPLEDQIQVFEQIAQGKISRDQADPAFVAEVEEAVDQLLVMLCVPPDVEDRTIEALSRAVWTRSPLSFLLAEVTWWLYQQDLITLSEAAQILFGDTNTNAFYRLGQLFEEGALTPYINPHEGNPRYAGRVRCSQVRLVKQEQDRPEVEQEATKLQQAEPQPDIIAMHDQEGLSFGEIGRRLGKHRQQIHATYHRLKGKQQNES